MDTLFSITWVNEVNNPAPRPFYLKRPLAIDYFTRPRSLYRKRQKWTSAIRSFDTNFLSYLDIVSELIVVGGVGASRTFPWFSMFFKDMFCKLLVVFRVFWCSFFYDFYCWKILFYIDLPTFFGEEASFMILSNFWTFAIVFICFSPRMDPNYWTLKLNFISSSGLNLACLSWFKAFVKNYFATLLNLCLVKI